MARNTKRAEKQALAKSRRKVRRKLRAKQRARYKGRKGLGKAANERSSHPHRKVSTLRKHGAA
jgi:hypothetical protein